MKGMEVRLEKAAGEADVVAIFKPLHFVPYHLTTASQ